MTRKDYVALAGAFARSRKIAALNGEKALLTWANCVGNVCDTLAADNPRFDRDQFVEACKS